MSPTAAPTRRRSTLAFLAFSIVTIAIIGWGSPAAADPPGPTNYESRITSITPSVDGIEASIVGGDSFVSLRVLAGEVVVLGYENEPYLRFKTGGRVEENSLSPAVVLNESRYGATVDANADTKAEPVWREVADGGSYVWHDHRIHWMVRSLPPQLRGSSEGKVFDWEVPLRVDGQPVSIRGELTRSSPPSILPYVALTLAAFGAAAMAIRRIRWTAAALLALVSVSAFVVSSGDQLSIPPAAGRRLSFITIPALAGICALVACTRRRSIYAFPLKAASALIVPIWIAFNYGALRNARLPGDVAPVAMRTVVAVATAVVVAFALFDVPRELREAAARNAALVRDED